MCVCVPGKTVWENIHIQAYTVSRFFTLPGRHNKGNVLSCLSVFFRERASEASAAWQEGRHRPPAQEALKKVHSHTDWGWGQ